MINDILPYYRMLLCFFVMFCCFLVCWCAFLSLLSLLFQFHPASTHSLEQEKYILAFFWHMLLNILEMLILFPGCKLSWSVVVQNCYMK